MEAERQGLQQHGYEDWSTRKYDKLQDTGEGKEAGKTRSMGEEKAKGRKKQSEEEDED